MIGMVLLSACSQQERLSGPSANASKNNGFAMVELFTSEGCVSCSYAEGVLPALQQQYGRDVYILSWHVDYWNSEKWKDSFSKKEFSDRQFRYSKVLRSVSIYTPQAVVNGTAERVGSDAAGLKNIINGELNKKRIHDLTINAVHSKQDVTVNYKTSLADGEELSIALVEKTITKKVAGGDNSGKQMVHTNVVLEFRTMKTGEGSVVLPLKRHADLQNLEIIAWKQNSAGMAITDVALADVGGSIAKPQ